MPYFSMKASTKLSEVMSLACIPATGHPGHFEVDSRKEPGVSHRVRLNTTFAPYSCQCGDWEFNCEPKLNKGAAPFQTATLCIHIARALLFDQERRLSHRRGA